MPKLKPETLAARRAVILDAAELCFARAGFHATSVHDICKAAGVSAGAFYIYFGSKEALIEGICERNRAEFAERFAMLAEAPDFLAALSQLADHYLLEESPHKRIICLEIGAEATRNPNVARTFLAVDQEIEHSFRTLFERLLADNRIAPRVSIDELMHLLMMLADGLLWRRAVNPDFDVAANARAVVDLIGTLINPVEETAATDPANGKDYGP